MDITPEAARIDDITHFFDDIAGRRVAMLRLDLLHPHVSGNKWFKLKENLAAAKQGGLKQLITFGGAWSNHLVAAAVAAKAAGLRIIGVVRGEHAPETWSHTLRFCQAAGMQLHFVSREQYTRKDDPDFLESLLLRYGPSFIIPEGGDNAAGRLGAGGIAAFIPARFTDICLPVGTGTTLAGLRAALPFAQHIHGFTAVKGGDYLKAHISSHLSRQQDRNWQLETGYSFGGFGKAKPELLAFMRQFYRQTDIELDIVYTGKMIAGMADLCAKNHFPPGADILCIHTGGLQGNPPDLFHA